MRNRFSGKIAVLIVLILLMLASIALGLTLFLSASGGEATGKGSRSSGGIDYALTLSRVERDAKGRFHVAVEVEKADNWHWKKFSISECRIVVGAEVVPATLLSSGPQGDFSEPFVLTFQSDRVEVDLEKLFISFVVSVEAEKYLGFSNASCSQRHSLPLEVSKRGEGGSGVEGLSGNGGEGALPR
jgi:hypothetical protein